MAPSISPSKHRWRFVRRSLPRLGSDASDRNTAENALRVTVDQLAFAERELRLTLDTIPALVWQARADGSVEYINKSWLDYTGLSPELALGWGWQEALHPDDRQRLLDGWRHVITSEQIIDGMGRIRGADGKYRWFLFQPAPLRDRSGKVVRWYGTNTNIEDRKRIESALQRSETFLAEAQRLSRTGSFGWNVSSGEIFWSDETFRIFEYEPMPNVPMAMVFDRVHPDDRARVERVIERAAAHKEAFDLEHRLQMPDGSVKHVHVVARALVDEPQNLQFAGAVMDITARKQAFAGLEASEQRYRHLFHHMPVALWQLNARGIVELFKRLRAEGVTDLGAYFDAHPGLVQRCMEMLKVEEVNEHTVKMLGARDTSEFAGTSIADYFPENSPTFRRSMVSRYRGDPNYAAETKLFTNDGRAVDVLYTASRVGQLSEPGMSLLGVIDITERKQAEEALRRSEGRYQNLFHAMAVAFFEFDFSGARDQLRALRDSGVTDFRAHFEDNPETVRQFMRATRIVEVNDHTVAVVGLGSRGGLIGSVEQFWPQESTQAYAQVLLSALERKPSFSIETPFRRVDGSVFDGHFTVWYSADEPTRGVAGVIDITERKQAFLALEKSEERYRHLFRNTPVALWQLNAQPLVAMLRELRASGVQDLSAYIDHHPELLSQILGAVTVEEVNDYAIQLFGVQDRKEVIGYPTDWMWRESTDTLRRALETRWRGEESFQETTKLVTRDGRVIDVLYTVARTHMIEGLPISLVSMIDLTERVRAQEELQRLRADFAHTARVSMLGELTATIAHEVNQPLGAIAASGEASLRWLGRPTPDVGEVRELATRMVADARRASDIIDRIRAMATRRVPEQALLSLDDVIREALLFLHHEAESRGVAVSHLPAIGAHKVLADRTQLQQVIVNLAVNAMQAMSLAGSTRRNISLRTVAHAPGTLRCSVEDSGPGIAPEHVARLFDSFFTTKQGGMGMGLRICRSVIEAHGGRIAADNESSQGGARFYFTLPVVQNTTG